MGCPDHAFDPGTGHRAPVVPRSKHRCPKCPLPEPGIDAYTIDEKIDDGLPATGKVVTYRPAANPGCATANVESTARYDVTNTAIACSLISRNAY
jgi:hypothetical protein